MGLTEQGIMGKKQKIEKTDQNNERIEDNEVLKQKNREERTKCKKIR